MRYKHTIRIELGVKGDPSYVREELNELLDAHIHKNRAWQAIESADVVIAIGQFNKKHTGIPLLAIIGLAYIRLVYKPIRNKILDLCGVSKSKELNN